MRTPINRGEYNINGLADMRLLRRNFRLYITMTAVFLFLLSVPMILFVLVFVDFPNIYGNTVFSANYSEIAFSRIKPGMDEEDVVRMIGEPLEKREFDAGWHDCMGRTYEGYYHSLYYCGDAKLKTCVPVKYLWRYSYHASGHENYLDRSIMFQNHKVVSIYRDLYYD